MSDFNEAFIKKIVYVSDNMEKVNTRKNIVYNTINGADLHLDIYTPSDNLRQPKTPVVILIHGEAPYHNMKDAGQYDSLGRLIASIGLTAVAFNHRMLIKGAAIEEVLNDINNLITYLRERDADFKIDKEKIAIWSISLGVPFGLFIGLHDNPAFIKCLIAYYGFGDFQSLITALNSPNADKYEKKAEEMLPVNLLSNEPSRILPLLIARAGLDNPFLNKSLDTFILNALTNNLPVDIYNHPSGHHAFDLFDDNQRTHEIIRKTLEFLKEHLGIL